MCSSGVFLNIGHTKPRFKFGRAWLNGVNAYAGLAAVDLYLGATELPSVTRPTACSPASSSTAAGT